MATLRQKKLAQNIVQNTQDGLKKNKQELVVSSGYTPTQADKKAGEIMESKGVQVELRKLGFDSDSAKRVVAEILEFGEDDTVRLNAAKEIFKVHGDYAAEKSFNLTTTATVDELKSIIQQDLAKFRPNK
jgi:hypothetical protein